MDDIKAVLADNRIGTLATINEDGSPWATPLHVFTDDEALYWFSQSEHQHSQNVVRDGRVSLALWSKASGTKGAYIAGRVEVLDDNATAEALKIVVATLGAVPPVFENTSAFRLPLGTLDSSKSSENRWYFYT